MELNFLGIGAAFYPALGSNSAYFIHEGQLYLLDCGESVFAALLKTGVLEKTHGEVTIALTHTHSDHCGSLGSLCLYVAQRLRRAVRIIHPDERIRTLLDIMGVPASGYTLLPSLETGALAIQPLPVRHLAMNAFAYLLGDGHETLYYSGDAGELPADIICRLADGRIARIYQDTMAFDGEPPASPPHFPLSTLAQLIEPALRGRVWLMHFNRDYRAQARAMGFQCVSLGGQAEP